MPPTDAPSAFLPLPLPANGEAPETGAPGCVDVAVPLPLPTALTYEVPAPFRDLAVPGARARVRVGKRRLTGVILEWRETPPEGVTPRPLDAVVDRIPVLPAPILELARFTAGYYLAPIGEVVRAMLPTDLPPWGDRKVWLTDKGALAPARDRLEERIVELLRASGRLRQSDLQARLPVAGLSETLDRMRERGRLGISEGPRRGARYENAVELAAGELEELLERCGRSEPAREVVRYLESLGRPATVREVRDAVRCGAGVVRRLVGLGVLRQFTQIAKLPLDHHELSPREGEPFRLRPDQAAAAAALEQAVRGGGFGSFLLAGITGSGKTEVYLRAVEAALAGGRTAILMVPEIALVPALARAARDRFGHRIAMLHSGLSSIERQQEWERIRRGEARVVLGPRSAVFAPLADLGLLVVDEEQDGSYKQGSVPRYQGRDLALVRGAREGAVVVVASATPSLETRHNVEIGKLRALELTERVGHGSLPDGILVDLREEGVTRRRGEVSFSQRLQEELRATFAAGDQAILLRNRRGYAPVLLCRACGAEMRCEDCGLPRTLHLREQRLQCHYCGSSERAPERCPECGESALEPIGAGTERVEERFRDLFPDVPADVLDRDTGRRRGGVAAVLERFSRQETQVLIGTQMVSKGHHFPQVALAAVLLADTYLGFPDFRAVERTYTLLTQLAGRAGRGDRPGKVVIQTYHPDHYAIRAALTHDDAGFAREEMRFRRVFHYPPYTRMIQLLVRDTHRARAQAAIADLHTRLERHPDARHVRLLGPAPAPFEKLRGKWRFQLLLRSPQGQRLRTLVREVLAKAPPIPDLVVDVDPYELL